MNTEGSFDPSLLNNILEDAPVIIGFHDINNSILWANKAYRKATGLSLEELKGKKCYDVWKLGKLCHDCPTVKAIETAKPQEAELTPQNQPHWPPSQGFWIAKAVPIKDKKGNIIGAIEVAFDITKRRKAEEDLRLSEERYSLAQRVAAIGSWDWDIETGKIAWSDTIEPMFGFGRGEFAATYEAFLQCLHPDDRDSVVKAVNASVEEGKEYNIEHRIVWPDGIVRWVSERGDIIRDENNKAIRMLGVVQDITDRRQAEEAVHEAANIKSQFTSMVSHELRTPLSVIKEGIDIVEDGTAGKVNKNQRNYLEIAKRNVDRLGRLINDVLDYQKLEAGQMEFRMAPQDVTAICNDTIKEFESVAQRKGLRMQGEVAKGIPTVVCDRDKIIQVLYNFTNNALKFTKKGCITVLCQVQENQVRIAVRDEGEGIRKDDQARLFESFSQVSRSGGRKTGGTGLGLAISKEIISRHQGQIGLESEQGKGSTFYFTLPIQHDGGVAC